MNAKFVITVGTQHCKSGALPADKLIEGMVRAKEALIRVCGGVSSYSGRGSWADDTGTVISEETCTLVSYGSEAQTRAVRSIAAQLRDDLDQHCVLFSVEPVAAELL